MAPTTAPTMMFVWDWDDDEEGESRDDGGDEDKDEGDDELSEVARVVEVLSVLLLPPWLPAVGVDVGDEEFVVLLVPAGIFVLGPEPDD